MTRVVTLVIDAVWGWPGMLLAFLLALEAAERTLTQGKLSNVL